MPVLIIIYVALGYWATGMTIYRNRILIGDSTQIFGRRISMGAILGPIIIPIAIIRLFTGR